MNVYNHWTIKEEDAYRKETYPDMETKAIAEFLNLTEQIKALGYEETQ